MLIYKNTRAALHEAEQKNNALAAQNAKLAADLDYLAMMAEIDLEEDTDDDEA